MLKFMEFSVQCETENRGCREEWAGVGGGGGGSVRLRVHFLIIFFFLYDLRHLV